jgi:TusA-related sulfurtransferase
MLPADLEVLTEDRDFSTGALLDLVQGLRRLPEGGVLAVIGRAPRLRSDLTTWSKLTGNGLLEVLETGEGNVRYAVRKGAAPEAPTDPAGPGERLWIYTNFHCNLSCDYCCVRSSPLALPRVVERETIRELAQQAPGLGFRAIYLTGGEPFLRPDIGGVLADCSASLPTTVLTNGTLLTGPRGRALETLSRDRLVLQVSLDTPTPQGHDLHRGAGSWQRAREGIQFARSLGYRVRVAATLADADARVAMDRWLASEGFPPEDRLVRPLARRGLARVGLPLARGELVPEITVTAGGVYWHPVGADDDDFRVLPRVGPLDEAVAAVQGAWNEERAVARRLAEVFHCA